MASRVVFSKPVTQFASHVNAGQTKGITRDAVQRVTGPCGAVGMASFYPASRRGPMRLVALLYRECLSQNGAYTELRQVRPRHGAVPVLPQPASTAPTALDTITLPTRRSRRGRCGYHRTDQWHVPHVRRQFRFLAQLQRQMGHVRGADECTRQPCPCPCGGAADRVHVQDRRQPRRLHVQRLCTHFFARVLPPCIVLLSLMGLCVWSMVCFSIFSMLPMVINLRMVCAMPECKLYDVYECACSNSTPCNPLCCCNAGVQAVRCVRGHVQWQHAL